MWITAADGTWLNARYLRAIEFDGYGLPTAVADDGQRHQLDYDSCNGLRIAPRRIIPGSGVLVIAYLRQEPQTEPKLEDLRFDEFAIVGWRIIEDDYSIPLTNALPRHWEIVTRAIKRRDGWAALSGDGSSYTTFRERLDFEDYALQCAKGRWRTHCRRKAEAQRLRPDGGPQ